MDTHCILQVVENGKVVLSGGYVDLTVVSDNSPSQSNNDQQAVKVRTQFLCINAQIRLLLSRTMMDLHRLQYLKA